LSVGSLVAICGSFTTRHSLHAMPINRNMP